MTTITVANTQTVTTTMTSVPVITTKEVEAALESRAEYSRICREQSRLEKESKKNAMVIFEKALGIKTTDELRELSPEEIEKRIKTRIKNKQVVIDSKVLFTILKTSCGRRPSWKEELEKLLGASKVTEIQESTPETFSYCVAEVKN